MRFREESVVFIKTFRPEIDDTKARREVAVLRCFLDRNLGDHPNVVNLKEVTNPNPSLNPNPNRTW